MRIRTTVIAMCLLLAVPAFAASRKDHDNCNGNDPDRMIAGCTRIIDDTSEEAKVRSVAYVSRALAWQRKAEREKALSDYAEAIRINPDDALAYNNRGILWRELKEVDRAIADFDEAIRRNPQPRSDAAGPGFVNVYTNRGLAWQAKGDYERAIADYDKGIELDPNDKIARDHRGRLLLARSDYAKAMSDLDTSILVDPQEARTYYMRGLARYYQYTSGSERKKNEDLDGAIADFTQALKLNPSDAIARWMRARAKETKGEIDSAIADLIEASRLDPVHQGIREDLKVLKPDYEAPAESLLNVLKRQEKARSGGN
jgi:tetratricopeptide (TPR) repeat protein